MTTTYILKGASVRPQAMARKLPAAAWQALPAHLRAAYAPAQNDAPQAQWAVLPGIGRVPATAVAQMQDGQRFMREWAERLAKRGAI